MADIYAAPTYYLDNRREIEDEFQKEEEWAEQVKANIPSQIPADLRGRFGA